MSTLAVQGIRHELLSRFAEGRAETEKLFSTIHPSALYDRPIPERHRIVFYIGHLEAFDWNLFRESLHLKSFSSKLDQLFAFGIDPVDGGLPTDTPDDWPAMKEVEAYKDEVRSKLDLALANAGGDDALVDLLNIAIEHRLMHAETLEYMFHQLPFDRKVRPATPAQLPVYPVVRDMIHVPAGRATLGLSRSSTQFGWDNEFDAHEVDVSEFEIDRYKVSNKFFLDFLDAGGYDSRELWTDADWTWRCEADIQHPVFWVRDGNNWKYRSMFEEVPLPMEGPVYVSYAEATAYAKWAGKTLPTEPEWQRAAQGSVAPLDSRRHWDAPPAGSSPETRSSFDVDDLIATGWEWTSTPFAPFPGFKIVPAYPGYSANFFDGKHFVMKGGSPRTAACMLRPSFRNWFQAHYQYVYAGFRCVAAK